MRDCITRDTAIRVYQSLVEPYFSYCAPVWDGLGKNQSEKLQKLQNRAARVITRSSYDISSSSLFEELNWESLSTKRLKQKAILMFNTVSKRTPLYLQEMFSPSESVYITCEILMVNSMSQNHAQIIRNAPLVTVEPPYGMACQNLLITGITL
jgi:hypothetical protein